MLASIGVGGMSSAAIQAPIATQNQSSKQYAIKAADAAVKVQFERMMSTPAVGIENHPCSWRNLNQRQIRKNRRRAHAAGKRNAFK